MNTQINTTAPVSALSIATLRKQVPAAFHSTPASTVSEKYQFIDSAELIKSLQAEGFVPVRAQQNRARTAEDALTTRHMLRFRKSDAKPVLNEVFPEVGFVNGHNGNVKFEMFGGLYRLVCSNGMVAGRNQMFAETRHLGDVGSVVGKAHSIITEMGEMARRVDAFKGVKVTKATAAEFAKYAAEIAFGAEHQLTKEPSGLLVARRKEDEGMDLWRVFNRVQENIIRGGIDYQSANGRAVQTKGITRVKRDTEVNAALWDLAVALATTTQPDLEPIFGVTVAREAQAAVLLN
jgi:hypothetical protein